MLSGDVHHAYVAEASFDRPLSSNVYQLTCSPLHNYVPNFMKLVFRVSWSRVAERLTGCCCGRSPGARRSAADGWPAGPHFGNEISEFVADGRGAVTTLQRSSSRSGQDELREVARIRLAG